MDDLFALAEVASPCSDTSGQCRLMTAMQSGSVSKEIKDATSIPWSLSASLAQAMPSNKDTRNTMGDGRLLSSFMFLFGTSKLERIFFLAHSRAVAVWRDVPTGAGVRERTRDLSLSSERRPCGTAPVAKRCRRPWNTVRCAAVSDVKSTAAATECPDVPRRGLDLVEALGMHAFNLEEGIRDLDLWEEPSHGSTPAAGMSTHSRVIPGSVRSVCTRATRDRGWSLALSRSLGEHAFARVPSPVEGSQVRGAPEESARLR